MLIKHMKRNTDTLKSKSGFTLLEVMIAVSIFGFLMLYVSQFMRLEVRLFDKATREDTLEQSTRFAMLHIMDKIRVTRNPTFVPGPANNSGIYNGSICIINLNPEAPAVLPDGTIYYYGNKLMFKKDSQDYLMADHIRSITFALEGGSSSRLLKIDISAQNPINTNDPAVDGFQLITWIRF